MGIEFPGQRREKARFESIGWLEGRTFLADFDEDGDPDLVRIDRSGILVLSGRDGSSIQQVPPSRLVILPPSGSVGGGGPPLRLFPGASNDPISVLFEDVDGDGLFDVVCGFPPGDHDPASSRRLLAISWRDGRAHPPSLLWDAPAPPLLAPRLSRDADSPGAPLLVTWFEGSGSDAPFRGAILLDAATGVPLRDPETGEELSMAPGAIPHEASFEPRLLGVLSRSEAGRTVLLVQSGGAEVTGIALDGDARGLLFAADVSWLAEAGSEILYVRDPDPIGLVHLAAGNRIMVFDASSGRLDARHVIPEPVTGLRLRRDASGGLGAIYVSGRTLLTATAVPVPYQPLVWGAAERSAGAAGRAGDLVETIALVAASRRGSPREREEGSALAERVLEIHLGRDERRNQFRSRPDPATADLLRVLATVARCGAARRAARKFVGSAV
jgi:hypothetical protein